MTSGQETLLAIATFAGVLGAAYGWFSDKSKIRHRHQHDDAGADPRRDPPHRSSRLRTLLKTCAPWCVHRTADIPRATCRPRDRPLQFGRTLPMFRRDRHSQVRYSLKRIGRRFVTDRACSVNYGLSMHSMPKPIWLERFAARLLELNPGWSALDSVLIAQQQYATTSRLDPAEGAEIYLADTAPNA